MAGENAPIRVRVDGLNKAVRALRKSGADMADMSELMHTIGTTVVVAAQQRAPHLSGALAGSIRAGRGKTKAVIRAGKARVPYAGVIHYGWPARNIAPHPFLTDALQQEASAIYDELDRGLMAILAKNGLTT